MSQPDSPEWEPILAENVPILRVLNADQQALLRRKMRVMLAEKSWEAIKGFAVTEEMIITVAAQACFITLSFPDELFDNVKSIIFFPEEYDRPTSGLERRGLIATKRTDVRYGEAMLGGPVCLSWQDVLRGGQNPHDGVNLVFHEFAHVLDMADQSVDGVPSNYGIDNLDKWEVSMQQEYRQHVSRVRRGRPILINPYGATDPAEFLAVGTEVYFERGPAMKEHLPKLYELFERFYRMGTAEWLPKSE
ncbi:Protein MtfA [Calycomorphotria hydatis]|uniref:Protein MtfA n=2 Tax=Calycomorphotria hydatis TaxID=2528027 RepID=A0A517TDB7_9PLAN|nr:Protein MtfA [Calycomorphotria hydatis]